MLCCLIQRKKILVCYANDYQNKSLVALAIEEYNIPFKSVFCHYEINNVGPML